MLCKRKLDLAVIKQPLAQPGYHELVGTVTVRHSKMYVYYSW